MAVDLRDTCRISQIYEYFLFYQVFFNTLPKFPQNPLIKFKLWAKLSLLILLQCFRIFNTSDHFKKRGNLGLWELDRFQFAYVRIIMHYRTKGSYHQCFWISSLFFRSSYAKPNSCNICSITSFCLLAVSSVSKREENSDHSPSIQPIWRISKTDLLRSIILGSLKVRFLSLRITSEVL